MSLRWSKDDYDAFLARKGRAVAGPPPPVPVAPGPAGEREDELQMWLVALLAERGPEGLTVCHPANGGARSRREAGRFKAMGVKAGMPDLVLLWRGRAWFLEIKTDKGRLTRAQREMLARLRAQGFAAEAANGRAEAVARLTAWGLLPGGDA